MPLQSLSTALHFSAAGMTAWRQVVVVPPAAHSVTPLAQIPIWPSTVHGIAAEVARQPGHVEDEVVEVAVVVIPVLPPFQLVALVGRSSNAM